jgi:Na+/proline symporter
MSTKTTALVLLISYVAVIVALAIRDLRARSSGSFIIAKRSVGWFPTMASIVGNLRDGAGIAAWVVLGIFFGFGALWLTFGLCIGLIILGLISGRVRRIAVERDYFSVNQMLRDQIGPATELVSTLIIAGMALLYAAVQVNIAGRIFSVLLNGPVVLGVVLTVVIVGGYLVIGGYATSIRTGVFQWFVIMVIVLLPWMITRGAWSVPSVSTITSPGAIMGIAFVGISLLVTVCSTDLWQLIFSSQSESDSRLGFYVSVPIYIVISIGMVLFATAVHAAVGLETKPENAFFNLFSLASVPPIAVATVGVFVAASIMSTLDSQVFLFCSTIIGLKSKAPTDDPATARPLRFSIIVVMVLLGLIAITITDLVEFLFGTVTLATILTPVLIISAMKSRTGVSDRGTAGALLVTSAIYIALFVLGAFENLIMTLIPAGVATLFVIVLLSVARRRID